MKTKIPIPVSIQVLNEFLSRSGRKPILSIIESHFLFVLVSSNGAFLKSFGREAFSNFIINLIEIYSLEEDLEKDFFGCGVLKVLNNGKFGIFDLIYDMNKRLWVNWNSIQLPDHILISESYDSCIDYAEIVRLNPCVADIGALKKYMSEKDSQLIGLPNVDEENFIRTENTNKSRYFMDYLLGYNKNFVIVSESQAGKTALVKHKMRRMLEQGSFKVI